MNPSELAPTDEIAISPATGVPTTLIPAGLTIEWWPIDRVKPYEKNARVISPKAVEKVAASIKEFGWRQPIVVDSEGVIVVGHVRLLGAQYLRLTHVPVHVASNLSPAQIKAYRLADNRTHEETTWNSELLGAELGELKALDFNLALTGFEFGELASFLDGGKPGLTDEDATPVLQELAVTRLGDLWVCGGRHRVMCGDSTSPDALLRLCSGKADMVFTDPPYNVSYEGYTEDHLKIDGDRMSPEQFRKFLARAFAALRAVAKAGASLYICHPSLWQREFQNALETAGFEIRCQIIWAKNTFAWGFGRYKFQHEPIFYCHLAGKSDPWYGDKSQSTLWQERKPTANRLHPTMKPVELIDRALANSSKAGAMVVDPFGGSGSTLIACHRKDRIAALMEIDPRYVDVICRRFMDFSGTPPILESTGQTFDEVGQERKGAAT